MPSFTSPVDGTTLFYRYYDPDPAIVEVESAKTQPVTLIFLHGWPMSSRMFDQLLVPLCETHRYRCIAPDRRGFGKSDVSSSLGSLNLGMRNLTGKQRILVEHVQDWTHHF